MARFSKKNNFEYESYVSRFKLQDSSFKFQNSSLKIQVSTFKLKMQVSKFKFQQSKFNIQVSRFMFQASRFKFQVSRFTFQHLSFKIQVSRLKFQLSRFKFQVSRFKIQFSLQLLCASFLFHYKTNWARYDKKYVLVSILVTRYSCHTCMKLDFFIDLRKGTEISNFIKIHPVGAEVFYVDGRTDTTKLIVAFSQFCEGV